MHVSTQACGFINCDPIEITYQRRKEGNSCLIMGYVVFNNHVFHSVSVRVRVSAHIMKCKLKKQQQKVSH